MEIKHRISINTEDKRIASDLGRMNIEANTIILPGNGGYFITIIVNESHPNWDEVVRLVSKVKKFVAYGEGDQFETIFSDDEIRNARWLRMIPVFEQGYPQPKMPWPFKQTDRKLFCPKCATYQQIAPMRIAKEPHLGKKAFMSTIWTNEIFCVPDVFQGLDEIQAKGFESWEVILHKSGQSSEKVQQLFIPSIASPGFIAEENLGRNICPACGTTKYYAHMRGIMRIKREAITSDTDFILTDEWFGSGYLAWREIIVSGRVARFILDKGWQGVRFKVVELI